MSTPTATQYDDLDVIRRGRMVSEPLGHLAPLDGIRAIAVVAVLLYHARFPWIPGGYLGVSTFFTLSGFLITSLLLREWNSTGGVSLRSFWVRRVRRLLPAAWAVLALVVAAGALGWWDHEQLRHLRGDVPWSLLQVVNWHFVAADRSYSDAFAAPSPLEHYWSLAIEQQFYLLFPLVALAVLRAGPSRRPARHRVRNLALVLAVLAAGSLAVNGLLADGSVDRAYFGSDTRLAELLVGALLATATVRRLRLPSPAARRLAGAAGIAGLAASAWLWHSAPLRAEWMYPWGFLATAVCSAALVLGAAQPGPLSTVLGSAPLRALGRISYGVYLVHWPVFLLLTPARTGWDDVPLFALRVAVTLVLAAALFRLVEDPVRRGARLRGRRALPVAGATAMAIVAGVVVVSHDLPAPDSLEAAGATEAVASATTAPPPPPPPVRVAVVGDSLAASLGAALATMEEEYQVATVATPGCGLALGGWVARPDDTAERDVDRCGGERERWVAEAARHAPEVVVVHGGLRDVTDRRLGRDAPWAAPGTPAVDDFLVTDVGQLVDDLSATGAQVVLLAMPRVHNREVLPPPPEPQPPQDPREAGLWHVDRAAMRQGVPAGGFRENDPARVDHFNSLLADVAERRGARYLDPAEVTSTWAGGELDPAMRPDGVRYSLEAGRQLGEWLLPVLRTRVEPPEPAPENPLLSPDAPLPPEPPPSERRRVAEGAEPKVLVVGDSVAFKFGHGLARWAEGRSMSVDNAGRLGCPVARGGSYRFKQELIRFAEDCDWATYFTERLNATRPEVVVLSSGIWEIVDRRLPGDDRFRNIGDPGFDRYLLREILAAIDLLGSDGARVVVLTQAYIQSGANQGFSDLPESDPARTDRLNELWREAVALRPGVATLIDFQAWLAAQPGGELDPAKRPDGVHFTDEYARTIADWLAPQLVEIARG